MKTMMRWLMVLATPFVMTATVAAKDYREGDGYITLANPQPTSSGDRIEVVELFWYGCPHCYELEPHIRKWLESKPDDVEFVRLPAIVGPRWEPFAQAYFTAELLGVQDKAHDALFEAIHEKKQQLQFNSGAGLSQEEAAKKTEAALRDFFVSLGVSEADFNVTFPANAPAMAPRLYNANKLTRSYAITGVPTVIVNGKYSTSGRQAGSTAGIMDVVQYLIEQERSATTAAAE